MKQIMTQAELIQYGRLRAEMPRAPGPSTGALPRRTGFGTEANKGLKARPKVSSNLVLGEVITAERDDDEEEEEREEEEEEEVIKAMIVDMAQGRGEELRSMIRVPWTQSLPSLGSLSTSLSLKRKSTTTTTCSGAKKQQQKRPQSWYEGMLLGRRKKNAEEQEDDEMDDIETGAGVGVGSLCHDKRSTLLNRRSKSSYSEPDLYSIRRLEELEFGGPPPCRVVQGIGEDTVTTSTRKDRVEEEAEEMMDYWTMIRSRNNRSRKRQIRSSESSPLEIEELEPQGSMATTSSTVYSRQSIPQQQYPRHMEEDETVCLEPYSAQLLMQQRSPLLPMVVSPLSRSGAAAAASYSQDLQEALLSPTSLTTATSKGSKNWSSSKRRNSQGTNNSNNNTLLPSSSLSSTSDSLLSSSTSSISSSSSSFSIPFLSSLPESQGLSGWLMLSLLFGGVYLVHGTNHFYNLQSAFLSIIL
jgi:hypothetical protein